MKNISFLIGVAFLVISCSVKNKVSDIEMKHKEKLNYPTLTNETELFDISTFGENKTEVSTINGDTIYHHYNQQSYEEVDNKRNLLKSFSRSSDDGTISGYDYSVNPILGIYKEFFSNGQIKVKGVFCYYGFRVGKWLYYNNEGLLTDTIDYDLCYTFNTDDIINFCKENKVPLEKVTFGHRTSIYKKKTPDGKCVWVIRYPRQDIFYYITLQIDASNGTILKTERSPFPQEEY